jgi:acetyl-CoA carboxylase, biotin carboxylase subunit
MARRRKKRRTEKILNHLLSPLPKGAKLVRKLMKTTKDSMPYIYEKVESLVKSHLISLEKEDHLPNSTNIDDFTNLITKNVMDKLPNLDSNKIQKIVEEDSSKSFIDMLTKGLSPDMIKERDYTKLGNKKPFKNVLIANRGEIALRIIRACKELKIHTTVIYSKPDKDGLAVKFADKSYNIGNPNAYLDFKKIIKIAKKAKADAIHPGYGFLSENANFAKLCEENKIKFIGPSSRAMELMGNKSKARSTMIKAKVPVIEGVKDLLKTPEHARELADNIGYPIIIKAVAGGGGRGMRVIYKKEDLESLFNSAKTEAGAAFGDDSMYMEKFIEDPKHIEFQILADRYGNVVHLGERDCSIQRRHQKLVEEAPSPAITPNMREEMGKIAIKAGEVVGYEGAGTVEFLLDKNQKFYFMEMNTRIQVEHGVTELITGVDLIKEQIKIAAGAKLAFKQEDIKIDGWAIECRINAESPIEFVPSNGTITNYLAPGGPGIRICSSSHTGHIISPHYDSMISKLMCRGKTRLEAISRMRRALDEYVIEGVDTTIPFHKAVIRNNNFIKGNVTTAFIDKNNILDEVKNFMSTKKKLTKKEKLLIVSTAVTKYLGEKKPVKQQSNEWVMSGRRELMDHDNF